MKRATCIGVARGIDFRENEKWRRMDCIYTIGWVLESFMNDGKEQESPFCMRAGVRAEEFEMRYDLILAV